MNFISNCRSCGSTRIRTEHNVGGVRTAVEECLGCHESNEYELVEITNVESKDRNIRDREEAAA